MIYECVTGEVPFTGNNGPSILLAILTKDPVPPSVKAAGAKYPVPPGSTTCIEEALAKNPNIRTKSVGALADAVGHAYGLAGDHRAWATTPQAELATTDRAEPAARHGGEADRGARRRGRPVRRRRPVPATLPMRRSPVQSWTTGNGSGLPGRRARATSRRLGVPAGKPGWLLPVVVGLLALVVGGAVTLVVMMH